MSFLPATVIKLKRDGHVLTEEQIINFVNGYYKNDIPDYQMSALLMAIVLKGMTKTETANLTQAMLNSGTTISFPETDFLPVDKHSTGGIGDKASLLIAPIVAACGVPVPMIAGRGLGHTGGTLDKLESIPGFCVNLNLKAFKDQVLNTGTAIIGQTAEICPADKKMYALRDVTGTVESLPLICGSILSKKIAEGIRGLVLDVKYGSGAFMKTAEDAEELARWLVETAEANNVKTRALITNMEEPLGKFIGNAFEVWECLAIFKNTPLMGFGPQDFSDTKELSLELSAEMLVQAGKASSLEESLDLANKALESGAAYEKFSEMVTQQGGDLSRMPEIPSSGWQTITAKENGFIAGYDTEAIGIAAIYLGAGRKLKTDPIDPLAGIVCHKNIGDAVATGDILFSFHSSSEPKMQEATSYLSSCHKISLQNVSKPSLILKRI